MGRENGTPERRPSRNLHALGRGILAAMSSATDILLIVALAIAMPLVFVGFWMGVCSLLALVAGWRGLASRYRVHTDPKPATQTTSGMVGLVSYNGVLQVGASNAGLDLRVMVLFRAGHPPLRIPWTDIRVESETSGLFGSQTKLRLGSNGPALRLPSKVWQQLSRPR
jgi:hypothetical protein